MLKRRIVLVTGLFVLSLVSTGMLAKESLHYKLSMPEPHTHYFEVQLDLQGFSKSSLELKMPVWAPGSYLIREFERNVESFEAKSDGGDQLKTYKTDKNTWRIETGKAQNLVISYRVYAFELSNRTSFLDADHGYFNGSSVFMYIEDYKDLPLTLEIIPYKKWNLVSTGLPRVNEEGWHYRAENYDHLVDCPAEMGNHKEINFEVQGVKHTIAMYGPANYDEEKLVKDFTAFITKCNEIFGSNPNKYYLFIIHNVESGGGGLEHMNSVTMQARRWNYKSESTYESFLTTAAHEYIHVWIVKRIRPEVLGPFDYNKEIYTDQLWVMEGFTSYFSQLILCQLGYIEDYEFINFFADRISNMEASKGTRAQSLSESSFDTWIEFYKTDENSGNTTVSYYVKGSVIANLLDLLIIDHSNGEKDLGDAMKYLYEEYYLKTGKGIPDGEFKKVFELFAGQNLDDFYRRYIDGTEEIDYARFLSLAGINVEKKLSSAELLLGVVTIDEEGKVIVKSVREDSPGWISGINANDEIIAVDGFRVRQRGISAILDNKNPEDIVEVILARDGIIKTIDVTLHPTENYYYYLKPYKERTAKQQRVLSKWLKD